MATCGAVATLSCGGGALRPAPAYHDCDGKPSPAESLLAGGCKGQAVAALVGVQSSR